MKNIDFDIICYADEHSFIYSVDCTGIRLPVTCNFLTGLFGEFCSKKAYRNRIRAQLLEKTAKHHLIAASS